MNKLTRWGIAVCLLLVGLVTSLTVASAQEKPDTGMGGPPKVLQVMREMIKPGRSGSLHEKAESAFVQAMVAAKWPTHYLAMDAVSGPPRSLFFVSYDSFEAWQKDNEATRNNATLSAALDRAAIADGDLLTGYDSSIYVYREDYSLRPPANIAQMHYWEISRFVVRPGHQKDWEALVKLYISGYEKAVPDANWVTYQSMYGVDNGGVYIVFSPMKSMAEADRGLASSKQFAAALGESGMRKLAELEAASVEAAQTNLFMFNPKLSYPSDEFIKSDPAFWKPAMTASTRKQATKPAQ
jgi:hypothetical protein